YQPANELREEDRRAIETELESSLENGYAAQASNLLEDKSDSYVGGTKKQPKTLKAYKTIAADGTEVEVSEGGHLE
ncbi:unnamed protein product, partial [Laminaria digitata]